MLLYQKPLTEIAVGESFQVTVTEADWNRGKADGICGLPAATNCAIAQAILRAGGTFDGHPDPGVCGGEAGFDKREFKHDGNDIIDAFDGGKPFPGPTVVTFMRES